jgi:DNA-binding MarR family transcriptional regulator
MVVAGMDTETTLKGETPEVTEALGIKDADLKVLKALRKNEGTVAFQGLRRQTNLHQEKLSRALQRLEEEELISREPKGYTLTTRGLAATEDLFLSPPRVYTTILQSMLPGNARPDELASYMEGRWFGNLRWLGSSGEGGRTVQRWIVEPTGTEIVLRMSWGQLTVETDAQDDSSLNEAFVAAHQLLQGLLQPLKGALLQSSEVKLLAHARWSMAG